MNQLESLFKNKLLEIGVRNSLSFYTNFEAVFNFKFAETAISELLLESKITYSLQKPGWYGIIYKEKLIM